MPAGEHLPKAEPVPALPSTAEKREREATDEAFEHANTSKRSRQNDFEAPGPHGGAVHAVSSLPAPLTIVKQHPPASNKSMWFCTELMPNTVLEQIYRTETVSDATGVEHKFRDGVNPVEGKHIYNCVLENKLTRTLEVGCAMGTSALYVCQAMRDANAPKALHVAVDPNQDTQYKSIGRANIRRAHLDDFFELIHETSYAALPNLLRQGRRFQLIFIDGWHTFDYTLVDFFFADLLLEVNGLVLLDDINHKGASSQSRHNFGATLTRRRPKVPQICPHKLAALRIRCRDAGCCDNGNFSQTQARRPRLACSRKLLIKPGTRLSMLDAANFFAGASRRR